MRASRVCSGNTLIGCSKNNRETASAVGVAVGVIVGVRDGVGVAVAVFVTVGAGVGVNVSVGTGVSVGGASVAVGAGVAVSHAASARLKTRMHKKLFKRFIVAFSQKKFFVRVSVIDGLNVLKFVARAF
jgi:hypothetical protein